MTKAEAIKHISKETGLERADVAIAIESFMQLLRSTLIEGDSVYLRGFGSFSNKKRAPKLARNISRNTSILVDAHERPHFKPSKSFIERVRAASLARRA